MSVRNHRVVAASILAASVVGLIGWGQSMAVDSEEIRAIRNQFQGAWVASTIEAGEHRRAEGQAAEGCSAAFAGKSVVFRNLVDDIDARGTFYLDSSKPGQVDFKLDAGYIVGIYDVSGDTLRLCLNPFALPERLGVPTLPRPKGFYAGENRHVYVFRRVAAGR